MADEFLTQTLTPGVAGLDLFRALDQISPNKLSRMTNILRNAEGEITSRPGQTLLGTTTAGECHSLIRANSPRTSSYIRLAGVGTALYCGTTGAFTFDEDGFSGNPLTFAVAHPPISADPWVYIGDSAKMRKVRVSDCLDVEVGLHKPPSTDLDFPLEDFTWPPPATWVSRDLARLCLFGFDIVGVGPGSPGDYTTYATQLKTTIDTCETAGWTNNAGTGGAPTNAVDNVNFKAGTGSLQLTTNVGGAAGAYYNFWNKANALNLNSLGGGISATDDDIIHLWLRTDRPDKVSEIRIYFVVSSSFNTATIPGTSAANNTEAYVKSFRPSDFTSVRELTATSAGAAGGANTTQQNLQQLPSMTDDRAGSTAITIAQTDASRIASAQIGSGRGTWTEFGVIGLTLHRRDFSRIGSDTTRTWSGVTGLVIAVQITDNTTGVNVWLDDIYLTGGYGLDSSLVGMQPYDYRHVNYDIRTGAKSNPSPIQNISYRLDSLRQAIVVTPAAYGDSNIRQQFFRRGGSLNDNWYFVGQNTGDGVAFTDTASDIQARGSATVVGGLLELDNDQPVTTVDAMGAQVLAQPLPAIWGPINDILLGCGDPYRLGDVYWSKVLAYDSWPSANHQEVCPPSEELMNGCVFNSQGYVFSRERMYVCYPNLQNSTTVTVLPTNCTHGLVSRYALAVGAGAIYFASKDGVYATVGGEEKNISDNDIRGLFNGETRNGYLPVDFSVPNAIKLEIHSNELWLLYRDTGGVNQVLIYSIIFNFWRAYNFGVPISCVLSEEGTTSSLLMGGRATGSIYEHTGTSDAGSAISAALRTGALDQSLPRVNKVYGDTFLDASGQVNITVTPLINTEATTLPAVVVTPGAGRTRLYASVPQGQLGRNMSLDYAWATSGAPPKLYVVGISYTPQPDTVENRVTNWDSQGKYTDKYVKGVLIECDTGGVNKSINLQVDGATAQTITVNANGRQVLHFSFSQFRGRLLRIAPADSVQWMLYSFQWIFDNEPIKISRWESQITNHGMTGRQTPTFANIVLESSAVVTMQLTTYQTDGSSTTKSYDIASTGGLKLERFVPFEATAGVLFKYLFTSASPFYLYRGESSVFIVPWGGDGVERKPFGDDDTDEARGQVPPTMVKP